LTNTLAYLDTTTKPIMAFLITLNTGDINYNDITLNINKWYFRYMFYL